MLKLSSAASLLQPGSNFILYRLRPLIALACIMLATLPKNVETSLTLLINKRLVVLLIGLLTVCCSGSWDKTRFSGS